MKFEDPAEVQQLCFQLKTTDYYRGQNRALINQLFNGQPPYSDEEVQRNGINVNVNSLEGTRLAHDARAQFYGAFLKPGNYFKATTDRGSVHKRSMYSAIVTREMNRIMKRSLTYFECFRSKFAQDVLHGIGISAFPDDECWCPDPIGIEDVMIPANTYLTMKNLPFYAQYRSFTVPELIKLIRGPKVDPAWNVELAEDCIAWVDQESMSLMNTTWPEVWSPEKVAERVKGDGGLYAGDQVPTIDVWDFYFWNDDNKEQGWCRRMVLDSWSNPQVVNGSVRMERRTGDIFNNDKNQFLYNSGERKFADKLTQLINFQFADLSAVAPFRYHSVRSLGFLLYAVCHLQNRLRCKFSESVFESLMMYFRVKSLEDVQRTLKVELFNRGFIDDTMQFVPANERFQVNAGLVELGLKENSIMISKHSSGYTTTEPAQSEDKKEKTRFQAMAEMQQATALVTSALMQAYAYQTFEYREIFRRFCRKNSTDPDVQKFRASCLRQDVPEELLTDESWDIEPDRVMGGGNKALEMNIAQQLLQMRNLFDPEPQREILRDITLLVTDDPAKTDRWVPDAPTISNSIHDAELRFGTLMAGGQVSPKSGTNHQEVIEALLKALAATVQRAQQLGGMATMEEIIGMGNVAQHIGQEIKMLAQDPQEKGRVKQYGDMLGKLMNEVKAFAQRLQEQKKKEQQQGNGVDPKDAAKVKGMMLVAQAKSENMKQSHAARTAQREIAFELEEKRKDRERMADLQHEHVRAAHELTMQKLKSLSE